MGMAINDTEPNYSANERWIGKLINGTFSYENYNNGLTKAHCVTGNANCR